MFEQGLEHEPRVAILCGHVPFHIDLKSGKWISDKESLARCDTNKEDVKRFVIGNVFRSLKDIKIVCSFTHTSTHTHCCLDTSLKFCSKVILKNCCHEGLEINLNYFIYL